MNYLSLVRVRSRRLDWSCQLRNEEIVAHDLILLGQDLIEIPRSLYIASEILSILSSDHECVVSYRPLSHSALRAVSQRNVAAGSSSVSGSSTVSLVPMLVIAASDPGVTIAPG